MRKAFRSSGAKEYFPGKNKQHRFKNQFVNLPEGKDIVDVEVGEKAQPVILAYFESNKKSSITTTCVKEIKDIKEEGILAHLIRNHLKEN